METFDGSNPNLISSKTIKDIESQLDLADRDDGNKVINGIGSFYNNYLSPNLFPIIVVSLLALYLTIKYILKKDREEREDDDLQSETRRHRTKKLMVKVDSNEILNKKSNININNKMKKPTTLDPVPDISDLISDDYLLTDDDNLTDPDNINNMDVSDYEIMKKIDNHDPDNDINKAAKLIFGDPQSQAQ
jgi:hypothetical protein